MVLPHCRLCVRPRDGRTRPVVQASGGKVAGSVRHPTNTSDFSSSCCRRMPRRRDRACQRGQRHQQLAQASAGIRTDQDVQDRGAGNLHHRRACGRSASGARPPVDHGVLLGPHAGVARLVAGFYERHGAMPTMSQAGVYSAAMHYLKAIDMARQMRQRPWSPMMLAMPVKNMFAANGVVRRGWPHGARHVPRPGEAAG